VLPTAASIVECNARVPVIATGGVRNGIDVLKSLGLGAHLCGIALPLLKPAMKSKNHVIEILVQVIEELKVAMFLCGCADIRSVKNIPIVVTGNTRQWLEGRNFDIK
jgi:isopentenyl-diphosphate delta-isomerase